MNVFVRFTKLENLLIGLLYAVVGAWLAFFPLTGIISLTVLLAATFVVEGLFKFVVGVQVRQIKGGIWMILSGIIAVAAGALILLGLHSTARRRWRSICLWGSIS